jgi:hypothetical protein
VKVVAKSLGDKYYKKKGAELLDKSILDSGHKLKLDQAG